MAKRKPEEVKKGLDEWMATYGDLVTLLLCFFVLLFASSNVDAEKFKQIAQSFSSSNSIDIFSGASQSILDNLGNGIIQMPEVRGDSDKKNEEYRESVNEIKKMADDFKTYFAKKEYKEKIEVEASEQYINLTFKDGVLFDSGKAFLKPESLSILNIVSDELLKYPDNDIKIEGHTDNVPINTLTYPSNWHLSAARAISVAEYFIDTKNIMPMRISTEGYGEYRPKAENTTAEGRATNRRVEIKIMSKYLSDDKLD